MTPADHTPAKLRIICAGLAAAFALTACGGGGGGGGSGSSSPPVSVTPPPTPTPTPTPDPTPTPTPTPTPEPTPNPTPTPTPPLVTDPPLASLGDAFDTYWNQCRAPRSGIDPYTSQAYPDKQGSLLSELTFLRAWSDQYYFWYADIPADLKMADFSDPIDYFAKLKASDTKDRYHFTYSSDVWDKLSNSGIELGYGVTWSSEGATAPRNWQASIVEPGSQAAIAGLRRGDLLTVVDGIDFVNASDDASVEKINAALFPATVGESHTLTVQRAGTSLSVTMQAKDVQSQPVKNTQVITTATGKVGYLSFENHNAIAERQLINAFTTLRTAGVSDLVLDMRYNGGGLLNIASELAYMVAGPSSSGMVFERLVYNDKIESKQTPEILRFSSKAYGFDAGASTVAPGTALPYLGLRKVTILTSAGTCSASEAVINALRGIDVEVNLIGGQTCGKPYGFTPVPNCGTTYFSIEFKGVNNKGFGDYSDGFAPTCAVADDLTHELGDQSEALLSTALSYRANGVCPVQARSSRSAMAVRTQVRPNVTQIAIRTKPRSK